jgi:peptidoglycan hydrolase-like protein with peptidoglycan-binding domain
MTTNRLLAVTAVLLLVTSSVQAASPIPPINGSGLRQPTREQLENHRPTVMEVQKRLTELGHYTGPVDGKWSKATHDALAVFQKGHGMAVQGWLSQDTLVALNINAYREP